MRIVLYKNSSEQNRLNKTISSSTVIDGQLKEGSNVLDPSFTISYREGIELFNYCFIPSYGRYYHIKSIDFENRTIILKLHVDVLMSHKADILKSWATVSRSQIGSKYLNDNRIVNTAQHTLTHRKIGSAFSGNDCYSLVVASHGGN